MKKVLGLLFVLVILLTSAVGTGIAETDATTVDREALIGTWECFLEDGSSEDILLTINEDSTCQIGYPDFSLGLTWQLDGETLSLTVPGYDDAFMVLLVSWDEDSIILSEEGGNYFKKTNSPSATAAIEPDSAAAVFLGEWLMYEYEYSTPVHAVFHEDGTLDQPMYPNGAGFVIHRRWSYEDGALRFLNDMPSVFSVLSEEEEQTGIVQQVFFEGERIILIYEWVFTREELGIISEEPESSVSIKMMTVLARPDNPLTEEEFKALQEKYAAAPEAESDAAE